LPEIIDLPVALVVIKFNFNKSIKQHIWQQQEHEGYWQLMGKE
jgi:hypothetical protein